MNRKSIVPILAFSVVVMSAGCASTPPGKVKIIPETPPETAQPMPYSPFRMPARLSWGDALVEDVEVPGRVAGGVFYPAHKETVIVSPGGYRLKNEAARKTPPSKSAYLKNGDNNPPGPPSLRKSKGEINEKPTIRGEPRVTAVINGLSMGEALVELTAPAGFKTVLSPKVNSALPVSLAVKQEPLGKALALLVGPLGYQAVLDLGKKEVTIDPRQ